MVRKHGPYCWYFRLNMKYLGYNKTAKYGAFCEELLSENDFEVLSVVYYCANDSEAVQKIATDQKNYHKCSSCVTVC